MFDLKITGGTIVDGTGADRFVGDIGIKDGTIIAVRRGGGLEGEATETIDATGTTTARSHGTACSSHPAGTA
jgi:N-acyl-D-amino-acid deacylase